MSGLAVSPKTVQRLAAASWLLLFLIVITGAAVRLTDSGLGCEAWPNCDEGVIIEKWSYHASIEFGNRLVTGLVGIVCLATFAACALRSPRRRDLIAWSGLVVVGVGIQAIIGRFSVTTHLHPLVVAAHFLGSPLLLWAAIVLWYRSRGGPGPGTPVVTSQTRRLAPVLVGSAFAVLALGTLVTGAGPHGGDTRADRLAIDIVAVARIHSIAVWLFLALLVAVAYRLSRESHAAEPLGWMRWLLVAVVVQGAGGYLQYALGIPPGLVIVHIAGATTVWCLTVLVALSFARRPPPTAG